MTASIVAIHDLIDYSGDNPTFYIPKGTKLTVVSNEETFLIVSEAGQELDGPYFAVVAGEYK